MYEAQFNLIYNANGGITIDNVSNMTKNKFLWLLRRLAKQKKDENDAIKKQSKGSSSSKPTDRRKYLGKL